MEGAKIQTLNSSIREALPAMRTAADENPAAAVIVRAIKFSTGAEWHISQETPLDQFKWTDVQAKGETDMGKAFSLLAEELRRFPTQSRLLPPVLVLITDGKPADLWKGPLQNLLALPWGQHAVRIAIAVQDAELEPLQSFINNSERHPLRADSSDDLVRQIKWVSTIVSGALPGKDLATPPTAPALPVKSASSVW